MIAQPDLFLQDIVALARQHSEKFTDDFLTWLPDNVHVYGAFAREALAARRKGFEHYSARTIIEFLRHHTAVHENGKLGWKLNNDMVPYLARLFDLANPRSAGLFEYREAKKVFTEIQ